MSNASLCLKWFDQFSQQKAETGCSKRRRCDQSELNVEKVHVDWRIVKQSHHTWTLTCKMCKVSALDVRNGCQMNKDALFGCLLGTAIGDALGLPFEGMTARRAKRIMGEPVRYRFVFGRGMMSDDTEHSCMVAESLIESCGNVDTFQRSLARQLRWWILGIPAGIGLATLKACLRLWLFIPPKRSGVFSAGNGAAMRSAILGAFIDDSQSLRRFVQASTQITHTDMRAEAGALAIAVAAQTSARAPIVSPAEFLRRLIGTGSDLFSDQTELMQRLRAVASSVEMGNPTEEFAKSIGCDGYVSGFVDHTVPVAIHAWLSHPEDWLDAVQSVIRCGGDADTTAAIVGAIVGCRTGPEGIPLHLIQRFVDWPRSIRWLEILSQRLASSRVGAPCPVSNISFLAILLRNAVFLLIVLFHGFRRVFPPY